MLVEVMADTAATSDTVDGGDMVGLVVMVDTAAMRPSHPPPNHSPLPSILP
jgi:hypothetical protein